LLLPGRLVSGIQQPQPEAEQAQIPGTVAAGLRGCSKEGRMRGRKPKPWQTQINEGDPRKRGVRKLQERLAAEPKAEAGFPGCPDHLEGLAREAWDFLAEQIESMGIDKRPDALMLEGACVNYARAVQADQQVTREGITVQETSVTDDGEVIVLKTKANPAVAVSNAAWRHLRAFASEFGLSPVSRTRITIEKRDDGEAELLALLSKPREPRPIPPVN
jgi:P27 family predicted phage terminase small subunit